MKQNVYATDEYKVVIGEPVVFAEVKASSTSVAIPCDAIPDGNYLVTLSVNSVTVADRDTFSFASGSCTVGDYTLAYSSYAVTVSTTEENDVVRLKIEPVEVYVTDAMKAAVAKVAPKSEGGGSGGGVLVVTPNETGTLDKTWQQIHDSDFATVNLITGMDKAIEAVTSIEYVENKYWVGTSSAAYVADTPNDYPVFFVDDNQ